MKINNPVRQWQLTFEGDWPTSVAFLGSGRRIAAGNRAGQIFIWDLPEEQPESNVKSPPDFAPTRLLEGHENGITHLRATGGGDTLLSASLDHTVRIWDVHVASSKKRHVVIDSKQREKTAGRKKGDEREAILNAPGIEVDVAPAKHVLEGHNGWVFALDVSADGQRAISGDDQGRSIVWDLTSRKQICSWPGYDRVWVRSAALSPNGKTVFTGEFAGRRSNFDAPAAQARLWNADDGSLRLDLLKVWTPDVKDKDRKDTYGYMQKWKKLVKRGLVCADFSPDGKLLAVGQGGETDTGQIHLVDTSTGKIVRTVSGHRYGACDVKFSADGNYVISSGRDTTARICQVSDGKEVAVLGEPRGGQFKDWVHAVAISPDQKTVATADIAGMIHVWRLET